MISFLALAASAAPLVLPPAPQGGGATGAAPATTSTDEGGRGQETAAQEGPVTKDPAKGSQSPQAAPSTSGGGQQGGAIPGPSPLQRGGPVPGSREAMWPAPTVEDWKKPVQITWQRTWEDARAVSEETGKPIMVAVNMDGEIASEHYAGIRYRDPEVGKLFEPYVNVIASVYRHNPRDYDENGNRIPCPRFGCVTCGEHIAMEPIVYERYLDETRVAPRHIGVELDGTEYYDVFYALDVVSVIDAWREGIEDRESTELPPNNDRSPEQLLRSRSQADRVRVEQQFRQAKRMERLRTLDLTEKLGLGAPLEVLRLALFGLDVEVASRARKVLAQQRSEPAIDLIAEALAVPMPTDERELLIGALEEMGKDFPRARSLSVTLRGLDASAGGEEFQALARSLATRRRDDVAVERYELEARMDQAAALAALSPEERGAAELERAEATLRLAVDPSSGVGVAAGRGASQRLQRLRCQDALDAARAARELGVESWRVDAVIGLAANQLGDREGSDAAVLAALAAMLASPDAASSETAAGWIGMGTLSLAADLRMGQIGAAARADQPWPKEWMVEVNAAFDLLARHPLGTEQQVAKHHDFLVRMGARGRAFDVLTRGVEAHDGSWDLHARLRDRLLVRGGVKGMEETYAAMSARPGASASTAWYAGYASMVAGEFRRRRAQSEAALASYDGALAHFAEAVRRDPTVEATAGHYCAMSLAGKAAVKLEEDELEEAADLLIAAFERWPRAANALDGLNQSAVTLSNFVSARLTWAGMDDDVARLEAAREALPTELLAPPEFERPPDTPAARNRDRRGRQRRGRGRDGGQR